MSDLDERYPNLSNLVQSILKLSLEDLASRAPADRYEFYDLERLLADTRQTDISAIAESPFAPFAAQTRGYLATIEEYIARNLVKNPLRFIKSKLAAPKNPRELRGGSEALDTIAECSWGLWLHDQFGNLEEERPLPGGVGDADFYVMTPRGDFWVDCISVGPTSERYDLAAYLSEVVSEKWRSKFGLRCESNEIITGICVSMMKRQEHVIGALRFAQNTSEALKASDSLWHECPGLRSIWIGLPPWHERDHRPEIIAEWRRP